MARITAEYIQEQIGYLRTDHEFYIVYDEEFGGDETDLRELRRRRRRAAKQAGMRVRTHVYEDDAVWVYDPDWDQTVTYAPPPADEKPTRRHLRAVN
jgi:hypothetical protein